MKITHFWTKHNFPNMSKTSNNLVKVLQERMFCKKRRSGKILEGLPMIVSRCYKNKRSCKTLKDLT